MKATERVLSAVIVFVMAAPGARAASFAETCPSIAACAKAVGEMLGQKYIFESEMKSTVQSTPNLDINRDNAELLFTTMLNADGYTRVPMGQAGTFQIMRQKDARDSAIPIVTCDERHVPRLPSNWDMYTFEYKASHPDALEGIARSLRSFMPAGSRIVPIELSGTLIVTDSALNLRKAYELIRDNDQKPTPELKKKWEEQEKRFAEQIRLRNAPEPAPSPKK